MMVFGAMGLPFYAAKEVGKQVTPAGPCKNNGCKNKAEPGHSQCKLCLKYKTANEEEKEQQQDQDEGDEDAGFRTPKKKGEASRE